MKQKIIYVGTSVKQARKRNSTTHDLTDAVDSAVRQFKLDPRVNVYNHKAKMVLYYTQKNQAAPRWYDVHNNELTNEQVESLEFNSEGELVYASEVEGSTSHVPAATSESDNESELEVLESEATEVSITVPLTASSIKEVVISMTNQSKTDTGFFGSIPLSSAFSMKGKDSRLFIKVGKTAALQYSSNKIEKVRIPKKQKVRVHNMNLAFSL